MNAAGAEDGNAEFAAGRSLPLLQDTTEAHVWAAWGVVYRDVVIVNPAGEKVDVYNLTEHDLADPANLAALEAKLRAPADGK